MEIHAVFGPTASGKSKLAVRLAQQHQAPLISVDSRKVFKYLDIGTNKNEIKSYTKAHNIQLFGIDLFEPTESVTVFAYREKVYQYLQQFVHENKTKTLVFFGGTGLYLDSLLFGLPLRSAAETGLRNELNSRSVIELQEIARDTSVKAFENLTESDKHNPRRLIRLIETANQSNDDYSPPESMIKLFERSHVTLHLPKVDRQQLYARIKERIHEYFENGWIEETKNLLRQYENAPALSIMGYREVAAFLTHSATHSGGDITQELSELKEQITQIHCNYAKRQLTWARRYETSFSTLYPARKYTPGGIAIGHYP
jgi:tRNA dimethylallyltransferase